jgi:hypothetical protein
LRNSDPRRTRCQDIPRNREHGTAKSVVELFPTLQEAEAMIAEVAANEPDLAPNAPRRGHEVRREADADNQAPFKPAYDATVATPTDPNLLYGHPPRSALVPDGADVSRASSNTRSRPSGRS